MPSIASRSRAVRPSARGSSSFGLPTLPHRQPAPAGQRGQGLGGSHVDGHQARPPPGGRDRSSAGGWWELPVVQFSPMICMKNSPSAPPAMDRQGPRSSVIPLSLKCS